MNAALKPIPLRPDYGALAERDRRSVLRAITAIAVGAIRGGDPQLVLKAAWSDDQFAGEVLRAVSNPLTTAGYPVANFVGLFKSIAPKSAALELFSHGATIDLTGINSVAIPYVGTLPASPFVAEAAPGPVLQPLTGALTVGPTKKILVMASVSRELDQATPQGAVDIVSTILGDAVAKALDAAAFGAAAATTAAPAGLLNNVTPLTASTAASAMDAMIEDVGALAGAIGDAGIDTTGMVLVCGPQEAVSLKMFVAGRFDYPILSSVAMKKKVAAFAAGAIASAYADLPQVETSRESLLQYSDSAPAADPLTAGPTRSAFQSELINIKLRGRTTWAVHPGGAQVVASVSW